MKTPYASSVFINCPFDEAYKSLLNALVFGISACGFFPRCALEFDDSDEVRINKIITLIGACQYGIHDLSRVEISTRLPRFNMPLELGIFIGCLKFGDGNQRRKKYLILEAEQFRFREFISDLSGQDIKNHENNPAKVLACVRNWLASKSHRTIPSASKIADKYQRFQQDLPLLCEPNEWTVAELQFTEFSALATAWLTQSQVE